MAKHAFPLPNQSHEARLTLIMAPMPTIRYIAGKSWAGCLITAPALDGPVRRWSTPYDEEAMGYGHYERERDEPC
jgi:hypothetical protein